MIRRPVQPSLNLVVLPSPRAPARLRAEPVGKGVRFSVFSPGARDASVRIIEAKSHHVRILALRALGHGQFELSLAEVAPDAGYRFIIDGEEAGAP